MSVNQLKTVRWTFRSWLVNWLMGTETRLRWGYTSDLNDQTYMMLAITTPTGVVIALASTTMESFDDKLDELNNLRAERKMVRGE